MILDSDVKFSKCGPGVLPVNAAFLKAAQKCDLFAYSACPFARFSREGQE